MGGGADIFGGVFVLMCFCVFVLLFCCSSAAKKKAKKAKKKAKKKRGRSSSEDGAKEGAEEPAKRARLDSDDGSDSGSDDGGGEAPQFENAEEAQRIIAEIMAKRKAREAAGEGEEE